MRLIEALELSRRPVLDGAPPYAVYLACGFEPLHLGTFLTACLRQRLPQARVDVRTGVFDDLVGNIERAGADAVDAVAAVIEWTDFDARLGLRRLGGWRLSDIGDAVRSAERQLDRLERALRAVASTRPIVCCPPTLALPPVFAEPPDQGGAAELALRSAVAAFAARLAGADGVTVCSPQAIDRRSPVPARRDVAAELTAGSPYSIRHASAVATLLARLIAPPPPMKGLITDLDETLWAGTLGEIGAANVSWSLDRGSHRHACYQQLLASLASAGVLIGVATRNDPALVADALQRQDLLVAADAVFPVQSGWGPKSSAIESILHVWNVAAEAVAFVDDSLIELAEARAALPGLRTIQFPGDDAGLWSFLTRVRALFGKSTIGAEDGLRMASIRAGAPFRAPRRTETQTEFLAWVAGRLEFSDAGEHRARAVELINKTSQFNLNGRRVSEAALAAVLSDDAGRLVTVAYEDKYGPLGTVAAVVVRAGSDTPSIETWVMSCRAFARRVEHHTLRFLFDHFGVDELTASYAETDRNAPVREFLAALVGEHPHGTVRLTRRAFDERAPALVHRVSESER